MSYTPKPMPVENIKLSQEITDLIESLSRNAHEIWAARRVADGWRVGPTRDDRRLEHPGLVPYDDLPESEREYDRKLVTETVKAIMALGYEIHKVSE